MNMEAKSNKNTTGSFEVYVDKSGPLKQDFKSFDVKEGGVEFFVQEGRGGPIVPRRQLGFGLLGKNLTGRYEVKDLEKVEYAEWSDMSDYRYKAKSGWIEIELTESPSRIFGRFDMVVIQYEGSPPGGRPEELSVSGTFDLANG
ncbi:hypothetical protein [Pseudomonas sp. GM102]|uniref:hypothetical protein n=1 Tax=Pseudomonas sp. GM102 TaxID=1144321 RepID=UPI0012F71CA7|nr:hypothetical protein [Pseudomonas sp. GM102]